MINEIRRFSTVSLHYTVSTDVGIFYSTYDKIPEKFQIGTGMLLKGIEDSIIGKRPGDRISVTIPPEGAYGHIDSSKIQTVERENLPADINVGGEVIGQYEMAPNKWTSVRAIVLELNESHAKIDLNHPLAGKSISLEIEIVDVPVKRKFAVFTIVKNESYFLPKWIKHYKRFLENENIYILDHQSNDGSTDGLDVNVIRVINEMAFDHQWLVDTVQNFQKRLLDEYECVIFAESDEMIYSSEMDLDKMVDEFLKSDRLSLRCKGFEIIQDLEKETPLDSEESIMSKRSFWFPFPMYNKTLVSRVPLKWQWGFHTCMTEDEESYAYGLTLCHLHRADFELMLKRHEERAKKWNLKDDGPYAGSQHRIGDREGVLEYFNSIKKDHHIESIPEIHKKALAYL